MTVHHIGGPGGSRDPPPRPKHKSSGKTDSLIRNMLIAGWVTARDIRDATGWSSVSVPQQARQSGLKLEKRHRADGLLEYHGYPIPREELAAQRAVAPDRKTRDKIIAEFREEVKTAHPDRGGSPQRFREAVERRDRRLRGDLH